MIEMSLNGIPITKPVQTINRFTMLLWGNSGCGKTTFAATAPGKKLWLLFDPGGAKALVNRDDILLLDMSNSSAAVLDKLKVENPLGIEKFITENEIETVVIDSMTSLSSLSLENAIKSGRYRGAVLETPGLQAYGHRNAQMLEITKQFLRSTGKTNTNMIFIAHEGQPEKDKDGVVMYITIMLGGSMPETTSLNLDEVWWMQDTGKERRIAIRPVRTRRPMKSRMFAMTGEPEFVIRFNADTLEGEGIAYWYRKYKATGQKTSIPK